jgi:hypothetical protein
MFVFLIDRFNETHIVDFKNIQGKYRTLCAKIFFQKQNIITLAADNTFNGICINCKRYYDEMYLSDLNDDVRMARSAMNDHSNIIMFHKMDLLGPRALYESSWERVWSKLNKAKSSTKNKSYKYYGK